MTTFELIDMLRYVDPDGDKTVGISVEGSGRCEKFEVISPENADWVELEDI